MAENEKTSPEAEVNQAVEPEDCAPGTDAKIPQTEPPPVPASELLTAPVSMAFAEQLARLLPIRLPGIHDTEREIFMSAGQQSVVMLVMEAAQKQAMAQFQGDTPPKPDDS